MLFFVRETSDDATAIREVVKAAFDRTNEADLVATVRNSSNFIPELSLVAKENGNVLGHILFSSIIIEAQERRIGAIALAPVAVTPARQRQGIGTQLIQTGLSKCREMGYSIVVVLGEPHYYRRFGFLTASKFGIQAPFPVPDEAFMVLELKPDALKNSDGIVQYPAYFNAV